MRTAQHLARGAGACLTAVAALCLAGCDSSQSTASTLLTGGDAHRGAQLIAQIGCGTCHEIPGIADADGRVGPPLEHIADRTIIAGLLPNTPDNMRTWLKNPQAVVPGNAMPNMELNDNDARDIAAYLYTLR